MKKSDDVIGIISEMKKAMRFYMKENCRLSVENKRLKKTVSRLEKENDSLLWEINNSLEEA